MWKKPIEMAQSQKYVSLKIYVRIDTRNGIQLDPRTIESVSG